MKVKLSEIKPNPFRDFKVDPLDLESTKQLQASINEDGFWGGVVARRNKKTGRIELAAGHRRVTAAMETGIKEAEIYVGDFEDEAMIRIYARENATQRGNDGIATLGSVAAAARYLIKTILKGDMDVARIRATSEKGLEIIRGQIASEKGLGSRVILDFIGENILSRKTVDNQLANLKASGHYSRLVKEATEEIAKEQAEELAELKRREEAAARAKAEAEAAEKKAKQAAEKAKAEREAKAKAKAKADAEKAKAEAETKKREAEEQKSKLAELGDVQKIRDLSANAVEKSAEEVPTFDLEGVSKWFKIESHLVTFRELICDDKKLFKKHLAVENQALLAQMIVEHLARENEERRKEGKGPRDLTAEYIADHMSWKLQDILREQRRLDKQTEFELGEADVLYKWQNLSDDFTRYMTGLGSTLKMMLQLKEKHPGKDFKLGPKIIEAVKYLREVATKLGL